MRVSHYHYSVPLPRRAVGRVLEIQTGVMGWLTGTFSLPIGGFILATFLALSNYLTPSGAREHARITAIPKGIGQGQVAVSGTLARTNVLGGGDGVSGRNIDPRRDEPRPASAGNVRQRHRVYPQRQGDRSPSVDSGADGFLHGLSLAAQPQNDQNARKKRTSLDCPARFR